jgi:hypothetical protein
MEHIANFLTKADQNKDITKPEVEVIKKEIEKLLVKNKIKLHSFDIKNPPYGEPGKIFYGTTTDEITHNLMTGIKEAVKKYKIDHIENDKYRFTLSLKKK